MRQPAEALQDASNSLLIGAGTIWEISIKVALRKLELSLPFGEWTARAMADLGAVMLPISVGHAEVQINLPRLHGDPFDRLLTAQAKAENLKVVSGDPVFDAYGIDRLWK